MMHSRKFHSVDLFFRPSITFLVLVLTLALGVPAQQSVKRRSANSDLPTNSASDLSEIAKENLDRVAASPVLLKEVLIGDPGLMVELKRWIAQEASDNGQILTDEDLSDGARGSLPASKNLPAVAPPFSFAKGA